MSRRLAIRQGERYGRLVVCGANPYLTTTGYRTWLCRCDCRVFCLVPATRLRSGTTRSCGCLQRELTRSRSVKHGDTGTRLYRIWKAMLRRCCNRHAPEFAAYGGRGISVCDPWQDYAAFRDWALLSGYRHDLTINRIDNDREYSPQNCEWIPLALQARNRRTSRIVSAWGISKCVAAWAEDQRCVVTCETLRARLDRGWLPETAITTPTHCRWHHLRSGDRGEFGKRTAIEDIDRLLKKAK